MFRKLPLDLLTLVSFLTLAGVTAYGLLETNRIILRWLALGLLITMGVLQSRYPAQDGSSHSQRLAAVLLTLQTILILILVQTTGIFSFLFLFFLLSATTMLYNPLRHGFLWLAAFILLTGWFLVRSNDWEDGLLDLIMYASGYLFLGILVNALFQARMAQQHNIRLLFELQAKNQQLEEFAQQVETLAAVEERNRLAREMHDTLGHRLTTAAVQLEAIQRLAESDPARASDMAGEVRQQVREALTELRQTVGRLREPVELELSLPQALRRLASGFQKATGLPIHVQLPEIDCPISDAQRLALFRAAQEGLTNIQRHAQARQAWLQLECPADRIILRIEDDGTGLHPEPDSPGFGIRGLRERASQLGGEVSLSARPVGGAILSLSLPVQEHGATYGIDTPVDRG